MALNTNQYLHYYTYIVHQYIIISSSSSSSSSRISINFYFKTECNRCLSPRLTVGNFSQFRHSRQGSINKSPR